MASSLERQQTQPKVAPLTPVLSEKYALQWQHAAFCGLFVLLFLMLSHAPLQLNGPWRNLRLGAAGSHVSTFGVDDPSVPLSAGMRQPQLSWMTSALLVNTYARFGEEGVAQLATLVLFAGYVIWGRCFFLLSDSKLATAVSTVILFSITNGYFGSAGPATFAFFCAALLVWMLLPVVDRHADRNAGANLAVACNAELGTSYLWWSVPLVMAVWCNMSGTFLVGMIMLLALTIGCALDAAAALRQTDRHWMSFWRSRRFQQSLYLLELSFLATCLHPLGLKLWSGLLASQQNAFWIAAGGGSEMRLAGAMGMQLLIAVAVALWVFRSSRLRIAGSDIAVMAMLLIPTMFNARLFAWMVPVFLLFALPHLAFGFGRRSRNVTNSPPKRSPADDLEEGAERKPLQFAFSLLCLLLIWMGFAFSPLSAPVLGGKPREALRLHTEHAPWGVARYLSDNPSDGLIWAPSYWSDWISWQADGPTKMFATSNLAALPGQVQRDYQRVALGDKVWDRTLGRYAVQTLVIDKADQDRLFNVVLGNGEGWRIVFESSTAIVLRRNEV